MVLLPGDSKLSPSGSFEPDSPGLQLAQMTFKRYPGLNRSGFYLLQANEPCPPPPGLLCLPQASLGNEFALPRGIVSPAMGSIQPLLRLRQYPSHLPLRKPTEKKRQPWPPLIFDEFSMKRIPNKRVGESTEISRAGEDWIDWTIDLTMGKAMGGAVTIHIFSEKPAAGTEGLSRPASSP
jgi:hypothetical protein